MTESDVLQVLRERHEPDQWAFFTHVPSGTGGNKSRTADAMAFNLWPSRGLEIHGFEVKVSRADFLGELKKPAKSAAIQQFCDRWWIATPKDVVKPNELPSTWGHIVITEKTSRIVTQAPKLTPEPLSMNFIAGLMRTVQNNKPGTTELIQAFENGCKAGRKEMEIRSDYSLHDLTVLRDKVRKFELQEGVSIERNYVQKPEEFKAFLQARQLQGLSWVDGLVVQKRRAEKFIEELEKVIQSVAGSNIEGQEQDVVS